MRETKKEHRSRFELRKSSARRAKEKQPELVESYEYGWINGVHRFKEIIRRSKDSGTTRNSLW